MTAINLNKDKIFESYFNEESFNEQRNLITDYSGSGLHPELDGGATVGVDAPRNFSATSIPNGSDFVSIGRRGLSGNDELTAVLLVKVTNTTTPGQLQETVFGGPGFLFKSGNFSSNQSKLKATVRGVNNIAPGRKLINLRRNKDRYRWIIMRYDGSTQQLFHGFESEGELTYKNTVSVTGTIDGSSNEVFGSTGEVGADFAYAGVWNRALSDAEIDWLYNHTAQQRANL